jgi:glycopeptide antibiotics resistance protein
MAASWRAPKPMLKPSAGRESAKEGSRLIAAYGFYFSVAFFCYGALFPFTLDLSAGHLSSSWAHASLVPFWDTPGRRLHGLSDITANFLFTLPLGFFGFLHCAGKNRSATAWKWGGIGMLLGLGAEILQLAIPSRSSGATDILINGTGAFLGAVIARGFGGRVLAFLTGSTAERRNIYLWLLILSMIAIVGPFDVGPDYLSRFQTGLAAVISRSAFSFPSGEEWIQIAGFTMIGAFASRLAVPRRRKRSLRVLMSAPALVVVFPVVLGCGRLMVESLPPSGSDFVLELLGSAAGFGIAILAPAVVRASSGFLLWNLALITAGLSPRPFDGSAGFQWIPFFEYITSRTPVALYQMIFTLSSFAVAGGLLQLAWARCRRIHVILYAAALASAVECAQILLPAHSANITNILLAGLGAWVGSVICAAVACSRRNGLVPTSN